MRERHFIEAVLDYTGASEVDVVAHSFGVTMSRRILKGGWVKTANEQFFVGPPLTNKVRTFIGIAGFNYGALTCQDESLIAYFRLCNKVDGLYPGQLVKGKVVGLSEYLQDLNDDRQREARYTVGMGSTQDAYAGTVNGLLPYDWPRTMDKAIHYQNYTHLEVRDLTANI